MLHSVLVLIDATIDLVTTTLVLSLVVSAVAFYIGAQTTLHIGILSNDLQSIIEDICCAQAGWNCVTDECECAYNTTNTKEDINGCLRSFLCTYDVSISRERLPRTILTAMIS